MQHTIWSFAALVAVIVVCFCQGRDLRHCCNAFFWAFCTCKYYQKHVSTCAPFWALISIRKIYYPTIPLLLPSPFCVWGNWKGYAHEPPPIHCISVTAKSLQWPNLLLDVVGNIMVKTFWTFSFGGCCYEAAKRAVIWLNSWQPLDWNRNISCACVLSEGHRSNNVICWV